MSSFEEHCEDCKKELGEEFTNVHKWLDELFSVLGPKHRSARHHSGGVNYIRNKYGNKAGRAAEIHIIKDCGKIPTEKEAQMWSLFGAESDNKGTEKIEIIERNNNEENGKNEDGKDK